MARESLVLIDSYSIRVRGGQSTEYERADKCGGDTQKSKQIPSTRNRERNESSVDGRSAPLLELAAATALAKTEPVN